MCLCEGGGGGNYTAVISTYIHQARVPGFPMGGEHPRIPPVSQNSDTRLFISSKSPAPIATSKLVSTFVGGAFL